MYSKHPLKSKPNNANRSNFSKQGFGNLYIELDTSVVSGTSYVIIVTDKQKIILWSICGLYNLKMKMHRIILIFN